MRKITDKNRKNPVYYAAIKKICAKKGLNFNYYRARLIAAKYMEKTNE